MNDVERDKLEWELKQRNEVAEILARQLNAKIDECEELKDMNLILAEQVNAKIDECEELKEHCRALKEELVKLSETGRQLVELTQEKEMEN